MGERNFKVEFISGLTCYDQQTGEEVFKFPGKAIMTGEEVGDLVTDTKPRDGLVSIKANDVTITGSMDDPPSEVIIRFATSGELSFTASCVWYPKTLSMSGVFRDIAADMVKGYLRSGGSRRVAHLALYARRYHDRAKNLARVYRHNMGEI
ncbi:MAG: hypothetical protein J6S14_15830 [Clostridia bacterium]|nr:hypothetical protein [Clostridia bacterium]